LRRRNLPVEVQPDPGLLRWHSFLQRMVANDRSPRRKRRDRGGLPSGSVQQRGPHNRQHDPHQSDPGTHFVRPQQSLRTSDGENLSPDRIYDSVRFVNWCVLHFVQRLRAGRRGEEQVARLRHLPPELVHLRRRRPAEVEEIAGIFLAAPGSGCTIKNPFNTKLSNLDAT
jgi:hypothetical protein